MSMALAVLLPTLFGAFVWQVLAGRARGFAAWCASLGAGYVLGLLAVGLLLKIWPGATPVRAFSQLAPWLAVATVGLGVLAWRTPRSVSALPGDPGHRGWIVAILLFTGLAFALIAAQATALPTLTWDAWNAWLAKSKAWYFADGFVPVLGFAEWLARPAGDAVSVTAPLYPATLPRTAVWMTSAAGAWSEPAIHALWPALWVALGLALYGHSRLAGLERLPSVLVAAGVLTLPMVTAHAALAGYADLWLAATLLLAGAHLARGWAQRASGARWRGDAALAAVFLVLLPAIKLEGAVWLACALAAIGISLFPRRWRWPAIAVLLLLWAVGLSFGGWPMPVPGLGTVRLGWGAIDVPVIGSMTLAWRDVGWQVVQSLFLLPNWSLFWYVLPLVLAARWHAITGTDGAGVIGWWLLGGYGFLAFLFFFTDASIWAENFTSINRLLLQVVPLTAWWLAVLWSRPAPRDTTSPSGG